MHFSESKFANFRWWERYMCFPCGKLLFYSLIRLKMNMNCLNLISLSRASFRIFIEVPFLNFYLEILMFSSNITFMCLTYWCMHLYLNNLVHQSYTTGNDHSMIYSKVPNISPGLIAVRPFWGGGLYSGGLYTGGLYSEGILC